MNYVNSMRFLVLVLTALVSVSGIAGNQDRDRLQVDRDQQIDRDRMQDRDRLDVQDRDRDRDRLRTQDALQLKDREIYGNELMTEQERNQYRQQIQNAGSAAEREELRAQHQVKMRARAKAKGIKLAPTSEGPIYGGNLMTLQERNQYREQMRNAESAEARERLRAKHQESMQTRARQKGLEIEDAEETE